MTINQTAVTSRLGDQQLPSAFLASPLSGRSVRAPMRGLSFSTAGATPWTLSVGHLDTASYAGTPEADTPSVVALAVTLAPHRRLSVAPRLLVPVAGVRPNQLVDTFTQARAAGARRHDAIDIMAPVGTPVLAAAAGRIEKLFLSKDGGKTIYVRSPDRTTIHYYAHLDHYASKSTGPVRAGDVIGYVGDTGDATGSPHDHFEWHPAAIPANWPASYYGYTVVGPTDAVNPYPILVDVCG